MHGRLPKVAFACAAACGCSRAFLPRHFAAWRGEIQHRLFEPAKQTCNRQLALAARRVGRRPPGGGYTRRRRQDADLIKFNKYGYPLPSPNSSREMEDEQQRWFESIEPPEGFPSVTAKDIGMTEEEVDHDQIVAAGLAGPIPPEEQAAAEALASSEGEKFTGQYEVADYAKLPEYGGEFLGMDDPLDSPWRKKAEEIVQQAIVDVGFKVYDITWHMHYLNVDVMLEGNEEESLDADQITTVTRAVEDALLQHDHDLEILQRYDLCVGTPGAKDVLTTDKEFKAFRGYEVHVSLINPIDESIEPTMRMGRLMERNPMHTILNVKGRNVTIQNEFVKEVRLPKAMYEDGDFSTLEDDWNSIFVDGKVPVLDCEYNIEGMMEFGEGVRMVEPTDLYVPPTGASEEEEEEEEEMEEDNMVDV